MAKAEQPGALGLIQERDYLLTELHGFEVTMSGRVIVPELHPQDCAGALTAALRFESQLLAAIDAAA